MKTLIAIIFVASGIACQAQQASSAYLAEQSAKRQAITARVRAGQKAALTEVADLDVSVAVPYLCRVLLDERGSDPELARLAIATVSKIKGHGDFIYQEILHQPSQFVVFNYFDALSYIKTKEAIKTAAAFLFDETPEIIGGDVYFGPRRFAAAQSLGRMNLPNPPTPMPPDGYGEEQVQSWRDWWALHQAEY